MKKKLLFIMLALLLVVFSAMVLSACNEVEFKVDFVVDGEVYATVNTIENATIKMPDNPMKDGYTFVGWYWDKNVWQKPFTANSLLDAPLSSDMKVYARFSLSHSHLYTENVTAPTCAKQGYTTHICTCGDSYVDNYVNATAIHTYSDNGLCKTCNKVAETICLYSIRGAGTTDEAISLVESILSRISLRKCGVKINLILIDEKDYAPMMFTKIKETIAQYNTSQLTENMSSEEIDELRNSMVDYADTEGSYFVKETTLSEEVANGMLDIFLCYTPVNDKGERDNSLLYSNPISADRQFSMFEILYKEQALAPIKSYLETDYFDLKNTVYPYALNYVEKPNYKNININDYYGVPNTYVYGSYEYLLFNEVYVAPLISPNGNYSNAEDYIPTNTTNTRRFNLLVNELKRSNLGANVYTADADGNIITFASYDDFNNFLNGNGYDFDGNGIIDNEEKKYNKFTVARIKGSKAVGKLLNHDMYANFDTYVERVNDFGNSCDSMYCIGRNTLGIDENDERLKMCLDVLTLINTNKEFRNILQYGVEGIHYTQFNEYEDVNLLNGTKNEDKYTNLNPMYFGNMFLLYTNSSMTAEEKLLAKNNWQIAKEQNSEVVDGG